MSSLYQPELYKMFAENLRLVLGGRNDNIEDARLEDLRGRALATAVRTRNGSYCWRSAVSSRMAARTVYLGSESVRLPRPGPLQSGIVEKSPEELHKVLQLMRSLPFVHLVRRMGDNGEFNPLCHLYMSVADAKSYRIPYMWGHTLADPDRRKPGPEFTMIHIPDEHPIRMQILALPEHNINIALGTDYTGEEKKGFLRQAMYRADLAGMLGLHAGTKLVRVKDAKDGKLKTYGVFMFGLTATGKSTWSCHQLGLDHDKGEGTWVAQDDIVFLKRDGSALGTETGFYVKTDVSADLQEAMYNSLADGTAFLENIMVKADGSIDFLDERLGENGRGVLRRDKLRVKKGRKMVCISADSINLPPMEELDGIVFAFITRRNTIMPFAQRLTPEQGILAYLWGESTHSFATVPEKAGESVRIVGMDDFIVGPQGRKVNVFNEMVMGLVDRCPDKVHFFQYNTGGMGEMIEVSGEGASKKKRLLRKVTRVPIDLMAALQRGDLRETNRYEKGRLGTDEVVEAEGASLGKYDPKSFYSEAEIEEYVRDIVDGRRKFADEIAEEGLDPKIARMSHSHLDAIGAKRPASVLAPIRSSSPETPVSPPQTSVRVEPPRSQWISQWSPRPPRPRR